MARKTAKRVQEHTLFVADTQREKKNKMEQENVIYSSRRIA